MRNVADSHSYIDFFMAEAGKQAAKDGRPVRCKGIGCFGCCKEPLHVERTEVQHMLETVTGAERVALTERVQKWWDGFRHHGFMKFGRPRAERVRTFKETKLFSYRAANLWCPFLVDGACTAYERRPACCRYHTAVGHPERCHDDTQRHKQAFMTTSNQAEVNMYALGLLADNAPTAMFEFDHLGVWLAQFLLGTTERSASAENAMVRQREPLDFPASPLSP